jgi:hypothetical protein
VNPNYPGRSRRGLFLATGGHDKPLVFKGAKMTVRAFFDVLDIQYMDEYFVTSMEEPDDILKVEGAVERAYGMGQRLVEALRESEE